MAYRYRRGAPLVLSGVDLDLPPGAVVRVAGRNGSGKSTLLRLLAGLARPVQGTVTGRPAAVGLAPERFPADQPVTVREHLTTALGLRGTGLDGWAGRLGLIDLLDTRLDRLSKGSAQKVGLVSAVAARPGLVVLDEPFAGLDAAAAAEVPRLVRELADGGSRVVLTDHERRTGELADAVWEVAAGRVVPSTGTATVVLRVEVDRDDAAALAAQLRREGLRVEGEPGA